MHYSLLNIKTLIVRRPLLSLMIVLSQIAAIMSVYLSVGFINNSLKSKQEAREDQLWFDIVFYSKDDADAAPDEAVIDPTWGQVSDKLYELYNFLDDDVASVAIVGTGNDGTKGLFSGILDNNRKVVKGPRFSCGAEKGGVFGIGDKVTVEGVEYTVTEVGKNMVDIQINPEDYPDTAIIKYFSIVLKDAVGQDRIKQISSKITELFGQPRELSEPQPLTLMQIQIDNMFIFTSAFILLIAVVNISVYFRYIFKKREKQTAIMKICGSGRADVFKISIVEMLGSYIISLAAALLIFSSLLPELKEKYKGFSLFDDRKYIIIFALSYFVMSAVVSVILSVRYSSSSPSESYKRAQKGGV